MLRAAWVVLVSAVLTGLLLAGALLFLRGEAIRTGLERSRALSQVIGEQTARTLQSVDDRLQLAVSRLDAAEKAGQLTPQEGRALLRAQVQGLPYVRGIWLLDASGTVTLDSEGDIGASLADQEYFQRLRQAPGTGFVVGPLVRSRADGRWLVTAARPLRAADGSLRGILTAAVEPAYFEQLWHGIDLGESGAVVLYRRDGQLILRSPVDEATMGRNYSDTPLFREYLPVAAQGVFIRQSPFDRVQRIVAYRELPTYPQLVVVVGTSFDEVLAPWRRFALLTAGVWAAALLLAAALRWQLHRKDVSSEATERRFAQMAQAVPQIVFIADARGAVQFVSQRWAEMTGRSVHEALASRWQEQVHPDDRIGTVERLRQMRLSGQAMEHEMRLRSRDGSYRWQLLRAVPFREEGQQWWYGTATDIDELKQAQARLHDQAGLLTLAGRLARMGGWMVDLVTQRVRWSEEAASILDMPADAEPTLTEVMAMIAPRSVPGVVDALQECVDHGRAFDVEVELVTPTGRRVWVRSIGQPVLDLAGKVVGIQGAQQDITQRVQMVEEIRELNARLQQKVAQSTSEVARQEALFRTLAQQAPQPFWTVDTMGAVTFFSDAWYALVGGAPPQWLGLEWLQLVHPDDLPEMRANWERVRKDGTVYAGVRRLRARDGSYHTTSYRAAPVRNEAGELAFWVGIDTDITDITANQAALRLANEQLEAFAYSVSHDLQSPLQRIRSFGRLLEEELANVNVGKARHYLARIRSNADTMTQLIEGLLALAQVSEVEMIRSGVNLGEIATEILQRLAGDQPQRKVRWQVQPGLLVLGDVRLLRSVLENLIGNAWKFTAGQPETEITVGGGQGEYFVRDNGVGFDMAYADRLFGTFQRLHAAEEFPGTGIGLATVARAVSRHGGRVWAQSAPGQGATFFFTLPASDAAVPTSRAD